MPSHQSVPDQVYGLFLSLLTASASMDARMAAFENGSAWFGAWAEAGHGDVSPAEMAIIVEQVCIVKRCLWPFVLALLMSICSKERSNACPPHFDCCLAPCN